MRKVVNKEGMSLKRVIPVLYTLPYHCSLAAQLNPDGQWGDFAAFATAAFSDKTTLIKLGFSPWSRYGLGENI
jgi:hypothetical protein